MQSLIPSSLHDSAMTPRAAEILRERLVATHRLTDRMFAWLMGLQWVAGIMAACCISPVAWVGDYGRSDLPFLTAIFLGGIISGIPIFMAIRYPGRVATRQVIAVGQMLSCGLLIHLTGGRIETHFQYFGALAFLAFYRDWRVLLTASVVAAADHLFRGIIWPQSIYGALAASNWRTVEHTGWILFEDIFLVLAITQTSHVIANAAEQQAELEALNLTVERKVEERTLELRTEITERLRAEETLRESEKKFRQLAENITDVFWMSSPDFKRIYYCSPAYELIWGRPAEDLYANPLQWIDAIIPQEREKVLAAFHHLMEDQSTVSIEYRIARPDGTIRWIHDRGFQIRDAAGQVIRLTGIATDITERKRTEEKLQLLGTAVQQARESILITDTQLDLPGPKIIFVNPAFTKMTGYEAHEVVGKTPRILHGPNTDRAVLKRLRQNLEEGGTFAAETFNYRKDGTEFALEWHVAPILDAEGKATHYVAIQHETTERKRVETLLFQAQKMETIGKLAGGVAHEFNSILTAIIGQSELLVCDLPPDGTLSKSAREIRFAADRAATLTRQLLAYGRKQLLQPAVLDLNSVVGEMVGTLQHLLGREVDVRFVPKPGSSKVRIDPGQMAQVIVNIAMNAADAMPNGGKFILETASTTLDEDYVRSFAGLKPGDYVVLAMSDTGIGMTPETKARAFEPFFSTKGAGMGTGLGLSTCYGIVKQSEGHISVYSELARGATFRIYLPAVDHDLTADMPKPLGMPQGTETILLAEDDPSLLEMAANLLRRLGYTVFTATDGVEALSLKNREAVGHIDLLLTDVVMPHMSGKELSDRIRAIYPRTKILYTSAYTENAIVQQGILHEGVTLLQKPFTPSALASKVREVLDRSSPLP